jgi:prepilin-type N-terminal cleavage/methylation domain-containing protein
MGPKEEKEPLQTLKAGISNERGVTLVELSVVIFLLSIVAVFTLPRFSGLGSRRLQSSANMLVGTVRYLANQAAANRQLLFLNYNFVEHTFWVTAYDQEGNLAEVKSNLAGRKKLLPGVEFTDIVTLHAGKVAEGEVFTQFFPNGLVETSTIHLRNNEGEEYTVLIHPVAGRATVYKGYVEQVEN